MHSMLLSLRPVRDDDLPRLYAHQADPAAHRMADFPPRDRDAFEARWRKILVDSTVDGRAVVVDGVLAGHVVAFDRDGVREVGYWIGRDHWGRGIATCALRLFLEKFPRRPLHAVAGGSNLASIRVLQKCGFEEPTPDELRAGRADESPEPGARRMILR